LGNVEVHSTLIDAPESSARAFIDADKMSDLSKKDPPGSAGNTRNNSISTAVAISFEKNDSTAFIGAGADVNGAGAGAVNAEALVPYDAQWLQLNGLGDVADKLNSNFGIQNGLFTSFVQANAQGEETAWSGSVNYFKITNHTIATIDDGARVNQ